MQDFGDIKACLKYYPSGTPGYSSVLGAQSAKGVSLSKLLLGTSTGVRLRAPLSHSPLTCVPDPVSLLLVPWRYASGVTQLAHVGHPLQVW